MRRTAADNKDDFAAEVVNAVYNHFYVDDLLISVSDQESAKQILTQLCSLLRRGGFELTKWLSNNRQVLSGVPQEHRAKVVKDLDLEELPMERVLGVQRG